MIYLSDIQNLISEWTERMDLIVYPQSYRDAISDCIYDLNNLVDDAIKEEMQAEEFFWSQMEGKSCSDNQEKAA